MVTGPEAPDSPHFLGRSGKKWWWISCWIGLRESLQENPKKLMVKTMALSMAL